MKEKELEYTYDVPKGFIEIDPSHYEEVGLTGFVKQSTLNFFVKVEGENVVSTISVNRDSYLDEETNFDSLLELNLQNLTESGFEASNKVELKRNDGTRLVKYNVKGKGINLVSAFTTIGDLFIGSSSMLANKDSEDVLINFMKSIKVK